MSSSTPPTLDGPAADPEPRLRGFARLGAACHDRRWIVLVVWIVVLVGGGMAQSTLGGAFRDEFNLPDVESKRGFDILKELNDGQGTGQEGTIVFRAEQGVEDPAVRSAMEGVFRKIARTDDVTKVVSPYSEEGDRQIASSGLEDGKIAYAVVEMPEDIEFVRAGEIRDEIREAIPDVDGLQVETGGIIFAEFEEPSSEALGLGVAIVILILAFGSVLAMGLPVGVALFGIGIGSAITVVWSHVLPVPDFATFLGIMIGLGVGIDYALLIVTRYREQLHGGHTVRESVVIAMDTAGRSVLFAGFTVVISLLGMLLMKVSFVQGLAVAASSVVAVTVAASLTLLPALLGFAGPKIEVTRWRGLVAAGLAALGLAGFGLGIAPLGTGAFLLALLVLLAGFVVKPLKGVVPHRPHKPLRETAAYRWSRVVQHHPWLGAGIGVGLLVLLAVPVLSLRLGFSDESNYDESTSTRKAYDLMVDGFGPGFGPNALRVVARIPDGVDTSKLDAITEAASADPGVAFASPPQLIPPEQPRVAMWTVVPETGPQDEATTDLVKRLRDDVLPPAEEEAGLEVNVSGNVAVAVDFSAYLASRLPWFFGAVLFLSFLLLLVVFRSLLVPLKAVVMNLLSIGAAYGVAVAIFQWGWLSDLTGVQPAPIEPWIPMMMFAIVFGLSMDYEVFLLSRVREEWHRTGDSRTSVADGLAATAKVITAAAAIMVFVFGSFLLERERVVKLMGTGLATAILLDATIVRMLLVPATMELLGDKNWWLPRWLDRLLPNIDVEGHSEPVVVTDADADERPADDERELEPAVD